MVTISQEGAKANSLIWPTSRTHFAIENYVADLQNIDLKYFDGSFTSLGSEILQINGTEDGSTGSLSEYGLSLIGVVVSTNESTHTKTVRFQVGVSDSDLLEGSLDLTYYGDGSETEPYYGDLTFYITGLKGEDGVEVVSELCYLRVYKVTTPSKASEITLSPEGVELDLEGNDTITVNYYNIIPNSITIDRSEVDENIAIDIQNKESNRDPADGSFDLAISCNSEAPTDLSYSFDVSGVDGSGKTYTTTGTIYIRP